MSPSYFCDRVQMPPASHSYHIMGSSHYCYLCSGGTNGLICSFTQETLVSFPHFTFVPRDRHYLIKSIVQRKYAAGTTLLVVYLTHPYKNVLNHQYLPFDPNYDVNKNPKTSPLFIMKARPRWFGTMLTAVLTKKY